MLRAFEKFFLGCPPRPLTGGLTPRDFVLVRDKQRLFGGALPNRLVDWLNEELVGSGIRLRAIGYGP
jgi:hypothetical protein